mmetsp:Transcript_97645/g.259390  ORF Transcript_97645/g.259390 Transcript_97645/m.259390 type:complete len:252 (-) Transcript_97645:863-1618(-)
MAGQGTVEVQPLQALEDLHVVRAVELAPQHPQAAALPEGRAFGERTVGVEVPRRRPPPDRAEVAAHEDAGEDGGRGEVPVPELRQGPERAHRLHRRDLRGHGRRGQVLAEPRQRRLHGAPSQAALLPAKSDEDVLHGDRREAVDSGSCGVEEAPEEVLARGLEEREGADEVREAHGAERELPLLYDRHQRRQQLLVAMPQLHHAAHEADEVSLAELVDARPQPLAEGVEQGDVLHLHQAQGVHRISQRCRG